MKYCFKNEKKAINCYLIKVIYSKHFHYKSKPIIAMKKLFSLLFMSILSLAVFNSTAQDEKKPKAKAKTEKKEKADKPEKKEKAEKKEKVEKKEKAEKKEKTADKAEKKEKKEKVEKIADKVEKKEKKEKVEKTADKVEKKEKKAADKDNTIKPAPAPKPQDDGKEADQTTRKKVAGADKQMGKDEKGRTIFEGSRGGQYYINSNGNKTYLKAEKKL